VFEGRKIRTSLTTDNEDVEDSKEGDTRDGVPSPLVPLTLAVGGRLDTGQETSDDHQDIGKDGEQGGSGGETGKNT
jgi:hypothetical protein